MKKTPKIAITGAAGRISYSLLFRVASGELLGKGRKLRLSLLEMPDNAAQEALKGVAMELEDCAFPELVGCERHSDPEECFAGADLAFLIGARPRDKGMERKDLLQANAEIFSVQGRALAATAAKTVKVLVVGNPANTNCLIAQRNAAGLDPANFSAMMRLDHNRAMAQVAARAGVSVEKISKLVVWGNHSATQFPDLFNAKIGRAPVIGKVGRRWYTHEMIPAVQQRGAAIINARGASSAASAASAAVDHMRDWLSHTGRGNFTSMAVVSNGEYGIKPGLVYSYPVRCANGSWEIVKDLEIKSFQRKKMKETELELMEERDVIAELLP